MTTRKPLTKADLKAIQAGHLHNPDVRLLLWEIRRLHVIVSRSCQFLECIDDRAQHTDDIKEILRELLERDPVVAEIRAMRHELLNPPQDSD